VCVPLPSVAPIIVAACAILDNVTAIENHTSLEDVMLRCFDNGIGLLSLACDGTETERTIQRRVLSSASLYHTYEIPHPNGKDEAICVCLASFDGHPLVLIQDAKHALKS
jgi:hypothetical protein